MKTCVVVSRHNDYSTETPVEIFSNEERYSTWLAEQDEPERYTAEVMDVYDALNIVKSNMLFGLKEVSRGHCTEEELVTSENWRQHERWSKWLERRI